MPKIQATSSLYLHHTINSRLCRLIIRLTLQIQLRTFLNPLQYTPALQRNTSSTRVQAIKPLHHTDKFMHPISKFPCHTRAPTSIELPPPIPHLNHLCISNTSSVSRRSKALIAHIRVSPHVVINTRRTRSPDRSYSDITAIHRLPLSSIKLALRNRARLNPTAIRQLFLTLTTATLTIPLSRYPVMIRM